MNKKGKVLKEKKVVFWGFILFYPLFLFGQEKNIPTVTYKEYLLPDYVEADFFE